MHTSRTIRNAGTISIYLLFCNPVKIIYMKWSEVKWLRTGSVTSVATSNNSYLPLAGGFWIKVRSQSIQNQILNKSEVKSIQNQFCKKHRAFARSIEKERERERERGNLGGRERCQLSHRLWSEISRWSSIGAPDFLIPIPHHCHLVSQARLWMQCFGCPCTCMPHSGVSRFSGMRIAWCCSQC